MFNKEFRDMRVRFFVMFFILLGTFILLVVMKDYTQNLSEIIRSAPKNILEKFGVTDEFMEKLSRWDFYIITQWYGKNLGQFVPILAIIMAFPVFAREIENETMELLLVRVKRKRLFMVKFFVPLVFTLLSLVVLAVLPLPVSWIVGESLDASSVFRYLLVETVGIFLWFSITIFFSVLFSDQVKPLIVSIALLAGTTALGSFIKPLSILNTYLYILRGELTPWPSLAYTLTGVVFVYLSYKVLETKDF
ncbi:ABC transporter permease [Thermotoga sp. SG1]|uniref:ABC transporter permease n=1 Tax=Thermotoga sp. SG1 TaxID=126739 RepID=UPI000C769AF7|nr:ABC transporter permease subunit [Thermotoga sp. SG1]PLV56876.1 ABC transporter permease [Thermotoga sp. SG1]